MARRLKDSQKKDLLEGYRSGQSTTALAEEFGCSQNTVIRTVKTLLSSDEYNALKAARSKGSVLGDKESNRPSDFIHPNQSTSDEEIVQADGINKDMPEISEDITLLSETEYTESNDSQNSLPLVLHAANECSEDSNEGSILDRQFEDNSSLNIFQEVVPLTSELGVVAPKEMVCEKLKPGVLPGVVYMLVDRSVELDARPLKDFPEFGQLPALEKERKAICLFSNQRSAKRNCGRSQRVIKIPNTNVFEISTRFLLARGITRLILEGSLIALDAETIASSS